MVDYSITDHSEGRRYPELFMQEDKPDSSLLLGAISAMNRQIGRGQVKLFTRREMLDLVVIDGQAKGIICRNLLTGEIENMLLRLFFFVRADIRMFISYLPMR
jgi:hypothetical protein